MIPPDKPDSRDEAPAKTIHKTAISIASIRKWETSCQLRERRRKMKRNSTPMENIKNVEICQAIRRNMTEETRKHDEKQISKASEKSKSLKQAR